jgi:hypothetical protein
MGGTLFTLALQKTWRRETAERGNFPSICQKNLALLSQAKHALRKFCA